LRPGFHDWALGIGVVRVAPINLGRQFQVKSALYPRPSDVPGDFGFIGERFWRETETGFYQTIRRWRRVSDV
jgi:hypothetical protein